jgi:hypothetical protein
VINPSAQPKGFPVIFIASIKKCKIFINPLSNHVLFSS